MNIAVQKSVLSGFPIYFFFSTIFPPTPILSQDFIHTHIYIYNDPRRFTPHLLFKDGTFSLCSSGYHSSGSSI